MMTNPIRDWPPIGSVVYISGPMTGYPQSNIPAFDAMRGELLARGCIVLSPADTGRFTSGYNGHGKPPLPYHVYLRHAQIAIDNATCLALLDGWENSQGVHFEVCYAEKQGKPIYYPPTMVHVVREALLAMGFSASDIAISCNTTQVWNGFEYAHPRIEWRIEAANGDGRHCCVAETLEEAFDALCRKIGATDNPLVAAAVRRFAPAS